MPSRSRTSTTSCPGLIEGRGRVYYSMGRSADFDARIMGWVTSIRSKVAAGAVPPGEFTDLDHLLHELRLHKSAAEQRQLRQAAAISVAAHRRAMRQCRPGMREYQLEAELQHEYARHGARHAAYPGDRGRGRQCLYACTTRATPRSCVGRPRAYRRRLRVPRLRLRCHAQLSRRAAAFHGASGRSTTWCWRRRPRRCRRYAPVRTGTRRTTASVEVITDGLIDLGLLRGRRRRLIDGAAYRRFYPHRVGHWLGLDVHDVGDYRPGGEWRQLEAGMVLTVEPGLYIGIDERSVPPAWRGIGIRIEDDVLVTADGHEVLSAGLPSEPDAIEALMA
jgi:Xaa-Pro aminopeptidase